MADLAEEFDFSSEAEDENEWKYDDTDAPVDHMGESNNKEQSGVEITSMENHKEKKISRMEINTSKAGMEGLDREKINQIIFEASKGSRFYENEKKKEKQVQKRIEELQHKIAQLMPEEKLKARQEMDKIVEELENSRDLSRTIVHIDMDAFYAAVEMRDDVSLKSKPMAVGGSAMLCTSNYLARRYGVRAGMPGFIAKKLCPHLVIVPGNFEKYTKISEEIREVMACYDPNYLPMSLDEAYLDLTDYLKKRQEERTTTQNNQENGREIAQQRTGDEVVATQGTGDGYAQEETGNEGIAQGEVDDVEVAQEETGNGIAQKGTGDEVESQNCEVALKETGDEVSRNGGVTQEPGDKLKSQKGIAQDGCDEVEIIVQEMRSKIEERTQLTASAGIAPNMFLAKVCSDMNKPNGQYYLKPERQGIMEFVRNLPIRKAFGIGRVSEQVLTSVLKINTCYELHEKRNLIHLLFSPTACRNYLEIALGLGSTVVDVSRERKSISTETTFREINKPEELYGKCYELCCELSKNMKLKGLLARKVGIKLKTVNFEVKSRVCSSTNVIQEAEDLFYHAKKLVSNEIKACLPHPLRLRLMGVRAAELCHVEDRVQDSKQLTITGLLKQNGNRSSVSQSSSRLDFPTCSFNDQDSSRTPFPKEEPLSDNQRGSFEDLENIAQITENSNDETQAKKETFVCPVCMKYLTFRSSSALLQFNHHVDTCLNTKAITDILKEDSQNISKTKQEQEISKKRKRASPNGKGKRRTIDHFLKK